MSSSEVPEWVKVWAWYRRVSPEDRRPFPQQSEIGALDYESVRARWLERDADARDADVGGFDFGSVVEGADV